MSILIVSVWGEPSTWKLRDYHIELDSEIERTSEISNVDNEEKPATYQATRSYKSTLGAFLECYKDANCLLLASSTLGDLPKNSYEEVKKSAERKIRDYLMNQEYCSDSSKVKVVILPGIGRFGENLFRGTINAYRLGAFLEILNSLKEMKPQAIILDLSHGLNYMPVYTRLATEDAVISYLVNEAKDEKLRLIVYNSEPVIAKEEKSTTTLISIVENISLNKDLAIQALYTKIASFSTSNPVILKSQFGKRPPKLEHWKDLWMNSVKFAKAAIYGLILPLAEYIEKLNGIDFIKMEYEIRKFAYLEKAEDFVERNEREVKYLFSPNSNLGLIFEIAKKARSLKEEYKQISERVEGGFDLDYLKRLSELILYGPGKEIAKNELNQLTMRVKLARYMNQETSKWMLYAAYIEFGNQRIDEKPFIVLYENEAKRKELERIDVGKFKKISEFEKIDKSSIILEQRNFVAHAGLEKNVTLILDKADKIFIKYNEEMRTKIDSVLQSLLN
jgi:CRISPR-associated protein Csx1